MAICLPVIDEPTCLPTECVRDLLLTITILQQLDGASSNRGSRLAPPREAIGPRSIAARKTNNWRTNYEVYQNHRSGCIVFRVVGTCSITARLGAGEENNQPLHHWR